MMQTAGDAHSAAAAAAVAAETSITALPADVLVYILSLLDAPSLASATSASSYLHSLSRPLWRDLSLATWPATGDPLVADLVSGYFPAGFRSLFSHAFPRPSSPRPPPPAAPPTGRLISAVDLRRGGRLIFSRALETEILSGWFLSSPFHIDALDRSESRPAAKPSPPAPASASLEELTLSWVLIDPARCRAANISSRKPVSVQRHWLSGEIQVRFATVLDRFPGVPPSPAAEPVQVGILVTCEGADAQVREVSLCVEDVEGMSLTGRDSLVILQAAMEGGRREEGAADDDRERYLEFLQKKRENKEKKMRKEGRLDMACALCGVFIFVAFLVFLVLR